MQEIGLRGRPTKKFKITINSEYNNFVVKCFGRKLNPFPRKLGIGINYIQIKESFLYLTAIIDLYDRKDID